SDRGCPRRDELIPPFERARPQRVIGVGVGRMLKWGWFKELMLGGADGYDIVVGHARTSRKDLGGRPPALAPRVFLVPGPSAGHAPAGEGGRRPLPGPGRAPEGRGTGDPPRSARPDAASLSGRAGPPTPGRSRRRGREADGHQHRPPSRR